MAVVVTRDEKARARHHLGYLGVESSSTFNLGVPAAMQTTFMIEGALDRLLPESYAKFKQLLCRLDEIECEVFSGIDLASINKMDTIEINRKRLQELANYYGLARDMLANILGVPANPWDFRQSWLGSSINVAVTG